MIADIAGLRVARKSWRLYIDTGNVRSTQGTCIACAICRFGPFRAPCMIVQPGAKIIPTALDSLFVFAAKVD
jgi:hypothetical protein